MAGSLRPLQRVALLDSLNIEGSMANDGDSDLCLLDLVSEVSELSPPGEQLMILVTNDKHVYFLTKI